MVGDEEDFIKMFIDCGVEADELLGLLFGLVVLLVVLLVELVVLLLFVVD